MSCSRGNTLLINGAHPRILVFVRTCGCDTEYRNSGMAKEIIGNIDKMTWEQVENGENE